MKPPGVGSVAFRLAVRWRFWWVIYIVTRMANEPVFKIGDQVREKVNPRHILRVERVEGDQVHVSWKQGKEKAVFQSSSLEKFEDYTGPSQVAS